MPDASIVVKATDRYSEKSEADKNKIRLPPGREAEEKSLSPSRGEWG